MNYTDTIGSSRFLVFNPHSPWLYVPSGDWRSIQEALIQQYTTNSLICNTQQKYCYFDKACDSLYWQDEDTLEIDLKTMGFKFKYQIKDLLMKDDK